jgi:hypothetical protein
MRLSRPLAAAALEISDRQSAVRPELNPPESARSAARQSECAGHARRRSSLLDLVGCLRSPLIMTHIVIHTESSFSLTRQAQTNHYDRRILLLPQSSIHLRPLPAVCLLDGHPDPAAALQSGRKSRAAAEFCTPCSLDRPIYLLIRLYNRPSCPLTADAPAAPRRSTSATLRPWWRWRGARILWG